MTETVSTPAVDERAGLTHPRAAPAGVGAVSAGMRDQKMR